MAPDSIHTCPLCGLRFALRTELGDHLAVDHPTGPDDDLAPTPAVGGVITVPLDPAAGRAPALAVATALARQAGFAVELVAAPSPGLPLRPFLTAHRRELTAAGVPTRPAVELSGPPAEAIVRHAADTGTTLLCLGTHARGPLTEKALGSVSADVLRTAPCPVVLVGPAVGTTGVPVRRVLVGVDGSLLAERALDVAVDLAERLGAELDLLEVLSEDMPATSAAEELSAMEHLARRTDAHARTYTLVRGDDPARRLAARAGAAGDTLLVVGSHGRTGLDRVVLGSVALGVARRAMGPVVVVPRSVLRSSLLPEHRAPA